MPVVGRVVIGMQQFSEDQLSHIFRAFSAIPKRLSLPFTNAVRATTAATFDATSCLLSGFRRQPDLRPSSLELYNQTLQRNQSSKHSVFHLWIVRGRISHVAADRHPW